MTYVHWFTSGANWSGDGGIVHRTVQHLEICGAALLIACLVALPLGIVLGHLRRGGIIAVQLSNVGRAIPILAVLIILALSPLGNSFKAIALALAIFAVPPILTNTYVGVIGVDDEVLEAARGMGMSGAEVLRKVEVPLALPLIAAGVRTSAVQVVATATVAAEIGAGGFGRYVIDGYEILDYPQVVGGAVLVITLALLTEVGLGLLQRRLTPGPRRARRRLRLRAAPVPAAAVPLS